MAQTETPELPDVDSDMSFWWALLSNRGQRGGVAIGGILVRQAIPLIGVLILHWSAQKFLLLAVINFGWNWTLLGVWNIATSALVKARRGGKPVPAGTWMQMTLVGAVVLCIVTGGFGFPVYTMSSAPPVFDAFWWIALATTLLSPLPNVVELIREGVTSGLSDDQIEAFAKPRRQLLMVGIIPIIGAYELLANFPYPGTINAVAVGYLLFATLCELRPDLAAEFVKELPS
jgi:hypothetical protein